MTSMVNIKYIDGIKFLLMVLILYMGIISMTNPKNSFDTVLKKNKEDPALIKKLQNFKKHGIEKKLETGKLTAGQLTKTAGSYIGTPHCMGGTTKKCIDCSGLLYAVFKEFNIIVPHNSEEQARYGQIIADLKDLKKGDLVFFIRSYNTTHVITHAGIYTGNDLFIHASSKKGVIISSIMSSYWIERFIFGTRVLK